MSSPAPLSTPARGIGAIAGRLVRDRHFMVAAVTLLVAAAGWRVAVWGLGVVLAKEAVAWPKQVVVDDGYRNTSLAKEFLDAGGKVKYRRVEEDGRLIRDRKTGQPIKDGTPDGENIWPSHLQETAGIGTGAEKSRIGDRKSNWYVSRTYESVQERDEYYRLWHLDVTYYTGGLDTVPHIGEVCLVAGGATVLSSQAWKIDADPSLPAPWNGPLELRRVRFRDREGLNQYVQYYVFSLCGQPEQDWKSVRLGLASLWKRYVYFAKIQIAPARPVMDEGRMDEAAEAFIRASLPSVLKELPTAADIQQLESAHK